MPPIFLLAVRGAISETIPLALLFFLFLLILLFLQALRLFSYKCMLHETIVQVLGPEMTSAAGLFGAVAPLLHWEFSRQRSR